MYKCLRMARLERNQPLVFAANTRQTLLASIFNTLSTPARSFHSYRVSKILHFCVLGVVGFKLCSVPSWSGSIFEISLFVECIFLILFFEQLNLILS